MNNPEITQTKPSGLFSRDHIIRKGRSLGPSGIEFWRNHLLVEEWVTLLPAPGWSFQPMRPTEAAILLMDAFAYVLAHQMQPDVLDDSLLTFIQRESESATWTIIERQLRSGRASEVYVNGIRWTPPAERKLDDWTVRAARIALAMWRIA